MSDLDIYKKQNFGNRVGFGERTALLIIDLTVGFNDPAHFGGGNIDAAVKRSVGLLAHFRRTGRPVAHSRIVYADDGSDVGMFATKVPGLKTLTEISALGQIVPELTPVAGELIVRKTEASAFFNSGLVAWLMQRRVDTLVVAGCTTSGCVRASVIDAASNNLRTIVATDCVGDRAQGPHQANLFDMGQKYADLMARDDIIATLA